MGGCSEGIIQPEFYRVLQPPWVVAQKKVSNTGYTGCYGVYRVRTFSLELGLVRADSRRGDYSESVGWLGTGIFGGG